MRLHSFRFRRTLMSIVQRKSWKFDKSSLVERPRLDQYADFRVPLEIIHAQDFFERWMATQGTQTVCYIPSVKGAIRGWPSSLSR